MEEFYEAFQEVLAKWGKRQMTLEQRDNLKDIEFEFKELWSHMENLDSRLFEMPKTADRPWSPEALELKSLRVDKTSWTWMP